MRDRRSRILAAAFVVSFVVASALPAQDALGHLDDASTPPKGLLRLRVAGVWTRYDEVFASTGVNPLAATLNSPALGTANGFGLGAIETQIQSATASPFTLSLGRARLSATGREEVVPIGIEYGITNRLSVGVVIPFMRKRVATQFRLDTLGSGANVGPNPNRTSTVAQNANVQAQFSAAAAQLQNRLSFCQANPSSSGCAAFLARQSEVQPLITSSSSFATTIGTLYGTSTLKGSAFVPMTQSAAQAAIALRVADFNFKYKDLLASSTDLITAIPKGAGGPVGAADFQSYVVGDLGRDSLNTQERLGIGDVELGAKMRVIDLPMTEARRFGAQLAVAGSVRLPTGSTQSPSDLINMRFGNGATTLDGRVLLDVQAGRFGILTAAQFATLVNADTIEFRPYGNQRMELDIAPRFYLSPPLSIHGAYSIRQAQAAGDQLVGGGITYSTLAGYKGSGRLPVEMRFTHLEAIKGDVGRPKFFRDQIEVRLYRPLR
jgi:hypothetical protein